MVIYTVDANQDAESLHTTVIANGDGTYTATAVVTHLSPFQVFTPPIGARIPQLIFPIFRNGGPFSTGVSKS